MKQSIAYLFGASALNTEDGGHAGRFAPVLREQLAGLFPDAAVRVIGRPSIQWPLLIVEGLDRRAVEGAIAGVIDASHDGRRS